MKPINKKIGNWSDKEVNTIIKNNRKKIIKDCYWLLDCERDLLQTNGYNTLFIDNLWKRFEGHFGKP